MHVRIMRFVIFLTLLISISVAQAQVVSRLTIKRGSDAYFDVNSLYKVGNGVSYDDWIQLDVYYVDSLAATTWDLSCKALTANINGDHGNTLNTQTIEVEASDGGGALGPAVGYAKIALTSAYQDIVTDGPEMNLLDLTERNLVNISIDVGQNPGFELLDKPSDFYTVDIEFMLDQH